MTLTIGCVSSIGELRQTAPTKTHQYHQATEHLSYCAQRAMESADTIYQFRLSNSPDRRDFFITATRISDFLTNRQMAGLEVHFQSIPTGTLVEMREGAIDGWWLARDNWPLIEQCSQQLASSPDGAAPTTAASPK